MFCAVDHRLQLGLLERHPRVARQRQHHQNGVDLVGDVEQVDALLQAAGVHALRGDVDRIARRAIGRQQFLDLGLDRGDNSGTCRPCIDDRIRAPDAGAAGHREHRDAVALRQRIGGQHGGDGDGLVEIVGNDKAVFGEHRVIGRRPAGHAGGMRGRGALAGAGAADFCHDDGLADFRRAAGRGEKFVDVADALDEQQDHVGRGILHHVVEELAGAEIALIAGADDITERNAERLGAMLDGKADAAALRDDADPPFGRDQRRRAGLTSTVGLKVAATRCTWL